MEYERNVVTPDMESNAPGMSMSPFVKGQLCFLNMRYSGSMKEQGGYNRILNRALDVLLGNSV